MVMIFCTFVQVKSWDLINHPHSSFAHETPYTQHGTQFLSLVMTNCKTNPLILFTPFLTPLLDPHLVILSTLSSTHSLTNPQSSPNIRNPRHILNTLISTENCIHFLDASSFGFGDEEVHPDDEDEAEDEEEVEGSEGDGFQHSWGNESDDELRILLVVAMA